MGRLSEATKRLLHRFLVLGENRLQLLVIEVQEGRERFLNAILMGLAIVALGLLSAMVLTAAVGVWCWDSSPALVLLGLGLLYAGAAFLLYWRFRRVLRNPDSLPATLDQLRKDRECLERFLL